jgi:hypothetical protein
MLKGVHGPGNAWLEAVIFLAALPLLLLALHAGHTIDGDEGVVLLGAWSLLGGRQLFVDDFQFITPASNYVLYWLWSFFGPEFWVAKSFGVVSIYLCGLAIYLTSKRVAPDDGASLSRFVGPFLYCAFSAFWPAINHNTFNACVMCWALYFGVRHVLGHKLLDLAACGLLTGISILFLQHKGGVLFFALTFYFLYFRFQERGLHAIKPLFLYGALVVAPLLTLLNWPASVLYTSLLEFPLNHYLTLNKTSVLPLVIAYACLVVIFASALPSINRPIQLILWVQVLLLGTCLQRPDLAHVLVLTFPMLTILFVPLDKLKMQISRRGKFVRVAELSRKLALITILSSGVVVWIVRNPSFEDRPATWPLLQEAKARCKSIYAGPFLPGVYYELRLQNPTSFGFLLTNFNTDEQFQKAGKQLEVARPDCAILHHANITNFSYDANNWVEEFFSSNYSVHQVSGATKLLVIRR